MDSLQATLIDCVNEAEKRTQKMIDARLLGLPLWDFIGKWRTSISGDLA